MVFIKKHIRLSFEFDGSLARKEKWQYPLEVIRELLLNAVVHRDYRSASDIVIKVFDDRIVFTNPGRIYGKLTIEDLNRDDYVSSLRNRLLAEAFYLTGDIEKYGTGFIRIRRILKDHLGISCKLSEMGDFFRIELAYDITNVSKLPEKLPEKWSEKWSEKLPPLQKIIVENMLKDPSVTYAQLVDLTDKSMEVIRKNIKKLKESGWIKRIGPDTFKN